jgi:hypothetical protein
MARCPARKSGTRCRDKLGLEARKVDTPPDHVAAGEGLNVDGRPLAIEVSAVGTRCLMISKKEKRKSK